MANCPKIQYKGTNINTVKVNDNEMYDVKVNGELIHHTHNSSCNRTREETIPCGYMRNFEINEAWGITPSFQGYCNGYWVCEAPDTPGLNKHREWVSRIEVSATGRSGCPHNRGTRTITYIGCNWTGSNVYTDRTDVIEKVFKDKTT